jgi:hypothetical protein
LRLGFDDGTTREVDLEDAIWGPVFEPLRRDPEFFRQVRVDDELGTIVWPNGADMDPDVLYGEHPPTTGALDPLPPRPTPADPSSAVDRVR